MPCDPNAQMITIRPQVHLLVPRWRSEEARSAFAFFFEGDAETYRAEHEAVTTAAARRWAVPHA